MGLDGSITTSIIVNKNAQISSTRILAVDNDVPTTISSIDGVIAYHGSEKTIKGKIHGDFDFALMLPVDEKVKDETSEISEKTFHRVLTTSFKGWETFESNGLTRTLASPKVLHFYNTNSVCASQDGHIYVLQDKRYIERVDIK
jgi:hypothetical protein